MEDQNTELGVGDPLISRVLGGNYRVVRLIGRGGMGSVYQASHIRLPKQYAVKVLGPVSNEASLARFQREAQVISRLRSPHIIELADFNVTDDGHPYMVMELLSGEDLGAYLKQSGRVAVPDVLAIGRQVAAALTTAHRASVVHRDLTPSNIFLQRTEPASQGDQTDQGGFRVKVLDFGLSKLLDGSVTEPITKQEELVGTPLYMSPEQARGSEIDTRSDLYSFAVVLYHALTGAVPFNAPTLMGLLMQIANDAPKPPSSHVPELSPDVDRVFARALAKNPDERPGSVDEFWSELCAAFERSELASLGGGGRVDVESRSRRHRLVAGVAVVTVLGVGGYVALRLAGAHRGDDSLFGSAASPPHAAAPPPNSAPPIIASPDAATLEQSAPLQLTISSEPTGARILIDGRAIAATTPYSFTIANPSKLTVRVELPGYEPFEQAISPNNDPSERKVHARLTRPPGKLQVTTNAPRAEFWLDGNRTASKAGSLEIDALKPGRYKLRVTSRGFRPREQIIEIRSSATTSVHLVLDRGREPKRRSTPNDPGSDDLSGWD